MKMVGLSGNASSCTKPTLEQNQMGQINLHLVQFSLSENHLCTSEQINLKIEQFNSKFQFGLSENTPDLKIHTGQYKLRIKEMERTTVVCTAICLLHLAHTYFKKAAILK